MSKEQERAAFFNDNAVCGNCGLTRGEHAREAFDYKTLTVNDNNVTWVWPYEACPVGPQPFHSDKAFVAARAASPVSAPVTLDQAREWRRINWYDSVPEMLDKALAAFANYAANGVAPVSAEQPTLKNPAAAPSVASEDSAPQPEVIPGAFTDGTALVGPDVGSEDWMRKAAQSAAKEVYERFIEWKGFNPDDNPLLSVVIFEEFAKHYAASQLSTEKK